MNVYTKKGIIENVSRIEAIRDYALLQINYVAFVFNGEDWLKITIPEEDIYSIEDDTAERR